MLFWEFQIENTNRLFQDLARHFPNTTTATKREPYFKRKSLITSAQELELVLLAIGCNGQSIVSGTNAVTD